MNSISKGNLADSRLERNGYLKGRWDMLLWKDRETGSR